MLYPRALLLAIALLSACTASRPLPLTQLDRITRIEVRNPSGATTARVIETPQRIERAVAAVRSMASGWKQPTTTLPAGDVAALFYRDTVVVGVVWLGQNYVMARGNEGTLIHAAATEDLVRLAEAFELPRKLITVPPRHTT